jgi:hypothetical protein
MNTQAELQQAVAELRNGTFIKRERCHPAPALAIVIAPEHGVACRFLWHGR